ncbi:MAG: hypothetical protein H7257_06750 [Taibaiella sp.]|nr:hypothetical protein [Taibaiella sp.]
MNTIEEQVEVLEPVIAHELEETAEQVEVIEQIEVVETMAISEQVEVVEAPVLPVAKLIICDARFREMGKNGPFDTDVTLILRKSIANGILKKAYSPKAFTDKKQGGRKEVWVKYQLAERGPFFEKTFPESTSTHKQVNIDLP